MAIGIEKLNVYAGRFSLDLSKLAAERGSDPGYVREQLMCEERSVYPPFEDAVTLAVNAARPLLTDAEKDAVELVVTATESGVDFGKPVATWVHRYCELPSNCRAIEVKHACYACTGALKMALAWLAAHARPGAKALVIGTDLTRPALGSPAEVIGGGCAVAMLVGEDPGVLKLDPRHCGYWTREIADTFRPTASEERVNDQLSLASYLDALEGAYEAYTSRMIDADYPSSFARHIYHAPFPGMTKLAHRTLRPSLEKNIKPKVDFEENVAPGLRLAKRIGTSYGASNFVSLAGWLCAEDSSLEEQTLSLFSYGSGCQGEFYAAHFGSEAGSRVRAQRIPQQFDEREPLSVSEYERIERGRSASIEQSEFDSGTLDEGGKWRKAYKDRGLLILDRVQNFERTYTWS